MTIRLPLLIPRETWRESTPSSDVPDVVAGIPMSVGYRVSTAFRNTVAASSPGISRIDGSERREETKERKASDFGTRAYDYTNGVRLPLT